MAKALASAVATALAVVALLDAPRLSAAASLVERQALEVKVTHAVECRQKSQVGDTISVHYNGTLTDGRPFDSSHNRHTPFQFTLGVGQVISGWDQGLLDMCVGEERLLTIPPALAYGDRPVGVIPAHSTLIFETKLVAIAGLAEDEDEWFKEEEEAAVEWLEEEEKEEGDLIEALEEAEKEEEEQLEEIIDEILGLEPPPHDHVEGAEGDVFEGEHEGAAAAAMTTAATTTTTTATTETAAAFGIQTAPAIDPALTVGDFDEPDDVHNAHEPSLIYEPFESTTDDVEEAAATQQPIVPPTPGDDDNEGDDVGECRLLGPFALFVQAGLGLLAILSLVWKRYRERPRRPFKVWLFDASKQVFGSALLHVFNLLMSMVATADFVLAHYAKKMSTTNSMQQAAAAGAQVNPCSWYLINIAIDTTIGIPILVLWLRILYHAFKLTPLARPVESIKSGHYGYPPKSSWWLKQLLIYFVGLALMKLCIYFVLLLLPWIAGVGDWALRWTEGSEALQVAFVMLAFPLVMNALQYYIIDSFIKDSAGAASDADPASEGGGAATQPTSYHTVGERDSMDASDDDDEAYRDGLARVPHETTKAEEEQQRFLGGGRSPGRGGGRKADLGKDA